MFRIHTYFILLINTWWAVRKACGKGPQDTGGYTIIHDVTGMAHCGVPVTSWNVGLNLVRRMDWMMDILTFDVAKDVWSEKGHQQDSDRQSTVGQQLPFTGVQKRADKPTHSGEATIFRFIDHSQPLYNRYNNTHVSYYNLWLRQPATCIVYAIQ